MYQGGLSFEEIITRVHTLEECPNLEYDEEFKEYICHGGCNEECPISDPFSCPATVDACGNPLQPYENGLDSETEAFGS